MKKVIKNPLLTFIFGAIIFGSIGVLASNILASQVTYNNTTVDLALNDLYERLDDNPNVTVLASLTDNFVQPSQKQFNTTITEDGILIVDMGAVDGNDKLTNNWEYYVKKNNTSIQKTDGYVNGYNGHYYWIINVEKDDVIEISTKVNYNGTNYNAVTLGVYHISK